MQVKAIAGLLEEKTSIPMVRDQMALIIHVQTDEFWQDVTLPLERVRRRLRALVKLIEKVERQPVYTNFEDDLGPETPMDLPGLSPGNRLRAISRKGAPVSSCPRRQPRAPQATLESTVDQ